MNGYLPFAWLLSQSVIEPFGWVLVHSLWQFTLLAIVTGTVRRVLVRSSATVRYSVFVGLLALSVCTPMITWGLQPNVIMPSAAAIHIDPITPGFSLPSNGLSEHDFSMGIDADSFSQSAVQPPRGDSGTAAAAVEPVAAPEVPAPPVIAAAAPWMEHFRARLQSWLPWIVAGWCFGVAFCALRPLLGWHTLWRLRHVGVSPVAGDLVPLANRIALRLGLRYSVRVLQSTLAQVPVVVGYLSPVILLPVSLMTSIPVGQLESILAHELAHIRRHDFVVNLLQTLVETFFFYHPAIWWISHLIRVEREHCCDDLVVRLFNNRVEYGRALLAIEELRGSARQTLLAPGATDGSLIGRVRRIVGLNSDRPVNSPWSVVCLVGCCLSAVCALSVLSSHTVANANLDDRQNTSVDSKSEVVNDADGKQEQAAKDFTSKVRQSPNPLIAIQRTSPDARLDADGAELTSGMVQRFGSTRFTSTGWWKQLAFAGNDEWLWMKTDNRVEVMHRETGRTVKHGQLRLGGEGVRSIAASSDGSRVAIGFIDDIVNGTNRKSRYRVVLISARTTGHLNEWSWDATPGDLNCLSLSGDGKTLASATGGNLRLWNAETGELLKEQEIGPADFRDAALSPDGQSAVFGGWGSVYFVNFYNGVAPIKLEKQKGSSVCFAPNGQMFATIADDGARLWDARTAALIAHLGTDDLYRSVDFGIAFTPDSRFLAIPAYHRNLLEVWDVESRKCIATFPFFEPRGLAISNNGKWLAGAGGDARIAFFDLQTRKQVSQRGASHSQPPLRIRFTGDGGLVTSSYDDARVWDIATGKQQHLLGFEKPTEIRGLAISQDGKSIVTNAADDSIGVWERSTGKRLLKLKGHGTGGSDRLAEFRSGGDQFATWGSDDQLRLWNVTGGKLVSEHSVQIPGSRDLKGPEAWASPVHGSLPRDANAIFVRFKQDLFEFDIQTGKQIRKVPVEFASAPLAISNDGQWLAAPEEAPRDARGVKGPINVLLIDRATMKVVRKWPVDDPHQRIVPAVQTTDFAAKPQPPQFQWSVSTNDGALTFSADSKRLAWSRGGWSEANGSPSGIDVVEVANNDFLASIPTESLSWAIEFSPDGRQIASGHYDTTTALWDIESPAFAIRTAVNPTRSPAGHQDDAHVESRTSGAEILTASVSEQNTQRTSATSADPLNDSPIVEQQRDAVVQRFVNALKGLKLTFLGDEEIETLRLELQAELTKRVTRPVSELRLQEVLKATGLFCTHVHYGHFKTPKHFMTDFEMLKWNLWTAMDPVELSPGDMRRRESQREWFRQHARSLPDRSAGKIGKWQQADGSTAEMTTLEFKLRELEDMMTSPFNPYFAWPFNDTEFQLIQKQVNERDWLVEKGKGDLSQVAMSVFYPVADLRGRAVSKRWPIEHRAMVWDGFGKNRWQWDSEGANRQLSSLKQKAAKQETKAEKNATEQRAVYTHPITVSGTALDENGTPIPGATIYLISVQHPFARLAGTTSDADGRYQFQRVPLPIKPAERNSGGRDFGSFEVFGTAQGKAFAWRLSKTYFPEHNGDSNPSEVLVDGPNKFFGADPIQLDLTFTAPKSIKGRIVDQNGKPIAQAKVEIEACQRFDLELFKRGRANAGQELTSIGDPAFPEDVRTRLTDQDGQFEFTGLPAECHFSLIAGHEDHSRRHFFVATTEKVVPQGITRFPLHTGDVDLTLTSVVEAPVSVVYDDTGAPAPNVLVSAHRGEVHHSAQTDRNGVAILRLPPGTYGTELLPAPGSRYLVTRAEKLVVTNQSADTESKLRLKAGCRLDVTIVDAISGQPIPDVDLWQSADLEEPIERRHEVEFRTWKKPTVSPEHPRSDKHGKLSAILEPGDHRIGASFKLKPQGYQPDTIGQTIACQSGETIQVTLKLTPDVPNPLE